MTKEYVENVYLDKGYDLVVGIDEVGRGPWAGPLYFGAFFFDPQIQINGVTDSKKLTPKKREEIYQELVILENHMIEKIEAEEIDEKKLGKAILDGLERLVISIKNNNSGKVKFLIDGYFKGDWGEDVEFVKKGDLKVYSIGAASIIAKVERDNYMQKMAVKYPEYGFESHVGYGTKKHTEALEKLGVCDIHRKSFKPVRKFL